MRDVDRIVSTRTNNGNGASRTDLELFVAMHSAHGGLSGDIGHLSMSAYRHTIACPGRSVQRRPRESCCTATLLPSTSSSPSG